MAAADKVDVVIAGAGAASSVYAAVLAEAGKRVLVLETGPARKLTDLYSSQIWARRLKWATPHVVEKGEHHIWLGVNGGRGFGGAAMHHYAIWPRCHEEDFNMYSQYGKALDWPIDYSVLRPFYDKVQEDVGMSGDAEAEIWRPPGDPYPLPPVPAMRQGEILARGFEALDMHVSPMPLAILTAPYKGRSPCIWDGWCDAGCPIGALANPLVEYFPRATAAGARMQADSHVTRVLTNKKGDRATGVEYVDANGERQVQHADAVVLAAFTIESTRILLNSRTNRHPNGLSNSNDMLGRYLMTHPSVYLFGMFEEETESYMGVTGGHLFNQDRWVKDKHKSAFGSRQWEIAQALKPNDLLGIAMGRDKLFGAELKKFMERAAHHVAVLASVCEDQPMFNNRIELAEEKDDYGMPLAQITYTTSPDGLALYRDSIEEGKEILKAAGANDIWVGPMGGQHTMGSAIMGSDPGHSVTNRYGQTNEISNLVVGSLGVMPTSSSVNSTFTLHALAMQSAAHIAEHWTDVTS